MYLEEDLDLVLKGVPSLEGKFLGSTVLLTGAGGFLGRYFVAVIKKLNSEHPDNPVKLIANDVFITSKQEFETDLDPNIVWIIGDASLSVNYKEKFDCHYCRCLVEDSLKLVKQNWEVLGHP